MDLHLLNDYTNSKVKDEAGDYDVTKRIKTVPVCPACHGGHQDNPKGRLISFNAVGIYGMLLGRKMSKNNHL